MSGANSLGALTGGSALKMLRQLAQSRHNQRKSPYFTAEGLRCCTEALQRRPEWVEAAVFSDSACQSAAGLLAQAQQLGCEIQRVSDGEFSRLACTDAPQGVLCLMRKPTQPPPSLLPTPCTIILDQVREPGNFGTILRTAWAAGIESVWYTAGSADPWSPKVVRSGMGAQFALSLCRFDSLAAAAEAHSKLGGTRVWCAMLEAPVTLFDPEFITAGAAIVLGNEANGVTDPSVGEAVTIPMPGAAESLNVAQAATLLIYEALRRQ